MATDIHALGEFLSQPDTVLDNVHSTYDASSWQVSHQLTAYGNWRLLPLVIGLSFCSTIPTFSPSQFGTRSQAATNGSSLLSISNGTVLFQDTHFPYGYWRRAIPYPLLALSKCALPTLPPLTASYRMTSSRMTGFLLTAPTPSQALEAITFLQSVQAPEVITGFGLEVATPILNSEHAVALEYLKSLLASAEQPWQTKVKRERPPPSL